jgi:hypothetical protein
LLDLHTIGATSVLAFQTDIPKEEANKNLMLLGCELQGGLVSFDGSGTHDGHLGRGRPARR